MLQLKGRLALSCSWLKRKRLAAILLYIPIEIDTIWSQVGLEELCLGAEAYDTLIHLRKILFCLFMYRDHGQSRLGEVKSTKRSLAIDCVRLIAGYHRTSRSQSAGRGFLSRKERSMGGAGARHLCGRLVRESISTSPHI